MIKILPFIFLTLMTINIFAADDPRRRRPEDFEFKARTVGPQKSIPKPKRGIRGLILGGIISGVTWLLSSSDKKTDSYYTNYDSSIAKLYINSLQRTCRIYYKRNPSEDTKCLSFLLRTILKKTESFDIAIESESINEQMTVGEIDDFTSKQLSVYFAEIDSKASTIDKFDTFLTLNSLEIEEKMASGPGIDLYRYLLSIMDQFELSNDDKHFYQQEAY